MTDSEAKQVKSREGEEPIILRPMTILDVDQIMEIERESFREPWTVEDFEREILSQDVSKVTVALLNDKVLGYTVVWYLDGEPHLANVAVSEDYRERGVGRTLVEYVLARAKEDGAARITLEVRESNVEARRLYKSLGFRTVGLKRNYYKKEREDAVVMRCLLHEGESGREDSEEKGG